ncbi:unnamed protein product [Coregonus sp. 'balchen']|nr:unnamed protein product [Coregonus sp. 'balchen']
MVDHQTIQPHLDRIQSCTVKHKASKNKKVEASMSNFVELVQTLLEDPAKREHFFQYGTKYDTALQILQWEFFSRLKELLPVPSFTQECVQSVSDPEHLETLLQHQRQLGHLNRNHLFYDSDTILSTLSLTSLVNFKQTSMEDRGRDTRKKEQEGGEEWRPKISYDETNKETDECAERLEEAGEPSSGQQKPGSSLQARPVAVDGKDIWSRVHYIRLWTIHDTCRKKWRLARDRHVRALKKSKDMPEGVPRPGILSWLTIFIKHRQTNPNFPEISANRVESPNSKLDQTPMFSDQAGPRLPLSSFRLLVPPLRLMSAFMWQVAQERNVMQYGKLEEFVTLVTEMVPELLSSRQRTQLILGLRARSCFAMKTHRNPRPSNFIWTESELLQYMLCTWMYVTFSVKSSLDASQSRNELEASESNFVELVKTLLEDPSEKKHFFQVVFPIRYGPRYDTALQILVWEFLSRLEELLPVPDLTETASSLSIAPSDLEEFWHSVSDPEHMKTLLQHHRHLGHLSKNKFSNQVADNILSTLSIPQIHGLKSSLDGHEGMKGCTEGWKINSEEDQEEGVELHCENNLEEDDDDGSERNEDPERGLKDEDDANWTSPLSEPEDSDELASDMPSQVFSCPQCPFSHREMVDLHQHIRKEHLTEEDSRSLDSGGAENSLPSRERPYRCKPCGKAFSTSCALTSHKRWHSNERPFTCSLCSKGFAETSGLKRHMFIHTEEKPHYCHTCGKGFSQLSNMRIHLKTHKK